MTTIEKIKEILSDKKMAKWYSEQHDFTIVDFGSGWLELENGDIINQTSTTNYGLGAYGDLIDLILSDE